MKICFAHVCGAWYEQRAGAATADHKTILKYQHDVGFLKNELFKQHGEAETENKPHKPCDGFII